MRDAHHLHRSSYRHGWVLWCTHFPSTCTGQQPYKVSRTHAVSQARVCIPVETSTDSPAHRHVGMVTTLHSKSPVISDLVSSNLTQSPSRSDRNFSPCNPLGEGWKLHPRSRPISQTVPYKHTVTNTRTENLKQSHSPSRGIHNPTLSRNPTAPNRYLHSPGHAFSL